LLIDLLCLILTYCILDFLKQTKMQGA